MKRLFITLSLLSFVCLSSSIICMNDPEILFKDPEVIELRNKLQGDRSLNTLNYELLEAIRNGKTKSAWYLISQNATGEIPFWYPVQDAAKDLAKLRNKNEIFKLLKQHHMSHILEKLYESLNDSDKRLF